MARAASVFICQSCGAVHPKWAGRCADCGQWNGLVEEDAALPPLAGGTSRTRVAKGRAAPLHDLTVCEASPPRARFGIAELDRVLGGGIVQGAVVLMAGDPGIGKSTLLLQAAAGFAREGGAVVYVSGEEAVQQIRLRAARLSLEDAPVSLVAEANLRDILATLEGRRPSLVIIDSIQTMWLDSVESAPGSVTQMRACAQALTHFARKRGASVILVGHVTKDGQIAGPRVVEHMVDCVLGFEGERGHHFRILRAAKNRFGPADEIGVFEMSGAGLKETPNPSALFLEDREAGLSGSAVFAGIEGTRPVLTEIQALVAASPLATPRRTAVGWDSARLSMLLAVLETRCGFAFAGRDVFLNVAGGFRINDPSADLAVAAALISAYEGDSVPGDSVLFGEIGLSGALRPSMRAELRLREAGKLGFSRAFAPKGTSRMGDGGVMVHELSRAIEVPQILLREKA